MQQAWQKANRFCKVAKMHSLKIYLVNCIVFCLIANVMQANGVSYNGFKHYRLVAVSKEAVNKIRYLEEEYPPEPNPHTGLTFLKLPANRKFEKVDLLVPPGMEPEFLRTLRSTRGLQTRLINGNYGRLIARLSRQNHQSQLHARHRREAGRNSPQQGRPTSAQGLTLHHNYYRSLQQIHEALNKLNTRCNQIVPGTCQLKTIGKTYMNNDLVVLSISKKSPGSKTKVWIDGGIHAREWISPATVLYIADELISGLTSNSSVSARALNNHSFLLLPMYNPDGYEYSRLYNRMWRKNREHTSRRECRGVDLNRNYGYKWGGPNSVSYACSLSYRGTKAFSAAETAAVNRFIEAEKSDMILFLSLHSYGQYILVPYSHQRKTYSQTNSGKMKCAANMATFTILNVNNRYYTTGTGSDLMYEANGSSDDWAHGLVKIPYVYTMELPDEGDYGFLLPACFVPEVGRETTAGLHTLLRTIRLLEANDTAMLEDCSRIA